MKTSMTLLAAALVSAVATRAAPLDDAFNGVNKPVPDGSLAGVADTQVIAAPFTQLTSIRLTLAITGRDDFDAFNGDLYATLVHDSGFSVLLNRPGRTASNLFGYDDNGLSVTLYDAAPDGDIHDYRDLFAGAFGDTLFGSCTRTGGRWTRRRSSTRRRGPRRCPGFHGLNPNGSWTLSFVADVETGGLALLDSWSLQLDGLNVTTVPEASTTAAMIGGVAMVGCALANAAASALSPAAAQEFPDRAHEHRLGLGADVGGGGAGPDPPVVGDRGADVPGSGSPRRPPWRRRDPSAGPWRRVGIRRRARRADAGCAPGRASGRTRLSLWPAWQWCSHARRVPPPALEGGIVALELGFEPCAFEMFAGRDAHGFNCRIHVAFGDGRFRPVLQVRRMPSMRRWASTARFEGVPSLYLPAPMFLLRR